MLHLKIHGFSFQDLFDPVRLAELSEGFYSWLAAADAELSARFEQYRSGTEISAVDESNLLVEMAGKQSTFVAQFFGIEAAVGELADGVKALGPLWQFKKQFLGKRVKKITDDDLQGFDADAFDQVVLDLASGAGATPADAELVFSALVCDLLADPGDSPALGVVNALDAWSSEGAEGEALADKFLGDAALWCRVRSSQGDQQSLTSGWASFKTPEKIDFNQLVELEHPDPERPWLMEGPTESLRRRDGFELTDHRYDRKQVMSEVDYCILCHTRDKDSCSKGVFGKDGSLSSNPLGIELGGCPLDEKISEMHACQAEGDSIAALALIMIDNPMVPGTGHRICNDCMKGCIYQKFDPVNIPQIETRVLTDVLDLPWGFEVYSLLSRWNPINRRCAQTKPYNGRNVLVVGLGPAGYTLAHYLLSEGFGVVGIDGLKLEPLPEGLGGPEPEPIANFSELYEELDERPLMGFGGVAEYGITVRWDKNFLQVMRVCLSRQPRFRAYGGVRFGGTLMIEDAWELGFDHVAIATGAGKPTVLKMKNNLIRGVRKASDFLMGLQLTGAQKKSSMTNLQVRLPAVVVGGGLTAIDTSTEVMAYYPVQVEKTLDRYETLVEENGEETVRALYFGDEEPAILDEFLEHGRAIRAERSRAEAAGELPDFVPLLRSWGGVTMAYRKGLVDSPAYRLNHEEVSKALEEGIWYAETLSPTEALQDEYGALDGLLFEQQAQVDGRWAGTGETVKLPARALFVAAGTSPNVIYEREHPGSFEMDERGRFFKRFRMEKDSASQNGAGQNGAGQDGPPPHPVVDEPLEGKPGVFTSHTSGANGGPQRLVSYFGDNHPDYAGNVVKAMASARDGYPQIVDLFADEIAGLDAADQPARESEWDTMAARLEEGLMPRVHEVIRLTSNIVEIVVKAPFATRHFKPGQFYRLQNYETLATQVNGTTLAAEGMALTGAWVDREQGLLSTIVLEMGGSSRLCATWEPGTPLVLMGPTGAPTEIPTGETVILFGGGLGNAVQFSIGRAMRERGNKVIYFAAYKSPADVYHEDDIEAAADVVVWSVDQGDPIKPRRDQDRSTVGNVLQALEAYATGEMGEPLIDVAEASRLIAIGSDRMMSAVAQAVRGSHAKFLSPDLLALGSINSTMQCMMKEICAQCLQKHIDPDTGEELPPVFSCFNQDQRLDRVDFANLNDRLRANGVLEKLTNAWLTHLFTAGDIARI
jgi:NADPH-dependent glutamate synthase beta subunit-like oxidoreductase/NAD(P)H-flavin reductase